METRTRKALARDQDWCVNKAIAQLGTHYSTFNHTPQQQQQQLFMPQGQAIPEPVHWIIIRLSTSMSLEDIAMYTDVSLRKVKEIISHFKKTGDVNIPKRLRPWIHQKLSDDDIEASILPGCYHQYYSMLTITSSCSKL